MSRASASKAVNLYLFMLCFCLLFLCSPLFEQPGKTQAGRLERMGSKYKHVLFVVKGKS